MSVIDPKADMGGETPSSTQITKVQTSRSVNRPVIDYLYYEVMTFTTVGYGDIVPLSTHGKLLAICTALRGVTHGVTFVTLMLQALTQRPPAKSQE